MTDIHHDYLLWELVSKEGVSEEHLADHIDEVDTVRQQHLKKAELIMLIKAWMIKYETWRPHPSWMPMVST